MRHVERVRAREGSCRPRSIIPWRELGSRLVLRAETVAEEKEEEEEEAAGTTTPRRAFTKGRRHSLVFDA